MDRSIVNEKLESLRRCIQRVESKRPETLGELQGSMDLQDILSVNLTRAVQVSVDLAAHIATALNVPAPETMADAFVALERADVLPTDVAASMKSAVGFRNVAVHAYQSINWAVVFAIAHTHLVDFRVFAREIERRVAEASV